MVCLVLEADGGRLVQIALRQVVLVYVPSLLQLVCLFAVVGVGSRPVQVLLIQHDLLVVPDKIDEVLTEIKSKVEKLWLYGEAGDLLAKDFAEFNFEQFKSLDELVPKALTKAKGAHLVFSPGFPSFDQYKNFEER